MCEEILLAIVGSPDTNSRNKEGAASKLLSIWDHRLDGGENSSVPILNSMWTSRQRLSPAFGSMMGMSEVYQISGMLILYGLISSQPRMMMKRFSRLWKNLFLTFPTRIS